MLTTSVAFPAVPETQRCSWVTVTETGPQSWEYLFSGPSRNTLTDPAFNVFLIFRDRSLHKLCTRTQSCVKPLKHLQAVMPQGRNPRWSLLIITFGRLNIFLLDLPVFHVTSFFSPQKTQKCSWFSIIPSILKCVPRLLAFGFCFPDKSLPVPLCTLSPAAVCKHWRSPPPCLWFSSHFTYLTKCQPVMPVVWAANFSKTLLYTRIFLQRSRLSIPELLLLDISTHGGLKPCTS